MFTRTKLHTMTLPALMLAVCVLSLPAFAASEEPAQENLPLTIETVSDEFTSLQTFQYDADGNLLTLTMETDMDGTTDTTTISYTYADGLKQSVQTDMVTDLGFIAIAQTSLTEYTYRDGVLTGAETTDTMDGETLSVSQTVYTCDESGLLTAEVTTGDDGSVETVSYIYLPDGSLSQVTRSYDAPDYSYDTVETYENGLIICQSTTGDGLTSDTQTDYDEHGNPVTATTVQDGMTSVSTFDNTYDAAGRLTEVVCTTTGEDAGYDTVQTIVYTYAD